MRMILAAGVALAMLTAPIAASAQGRHMHGGGHGFHRGGFHGGGFGGHRRGFGGPGYRDGYHHHRHHVLRRILRNL